MTRPRLLDGSDAVPWDEVRHARVRARALAKFHEERSRPPRRPHRVRWALAGLAFATVLAGLLILQLRSSQRSVASSVGFAPPADELSRRELADGSFALLATNAQLQTDHYTPQRLELSQRSGWVQYNVIPDPDRAFVVTARSVRVRVTGTVFSVRTTSSSTDVLVQRGSVEVQHGERQFRLAAGDRISIRTPRERSGSGEQSEPTGPRSVAPLSRLNAPKPEPASRQSSDVASESEASRGRPEPRGARPSRAVPSSSPSEPPASMSELLERADARRRAGQLAQAAQLLRAAATQNAGDPRALLAWFTLGKVERQRGNLESAARAFESSGQAMAGEGIAEAARCWAQAGAAKRARKLAQEYLRTHPDGPWVESMTTIAKPR